MSASGFRRGLAAAALTLALPLAQASGAEITPLSQDRSVDVQVDNYHWRCTGVYLPGGECDIPIEVITDETTSDGQTAADFSPFSGSASALVEGTTSWASQEPALSGASITASGDFQADGEHRRYVEFPIIPHEQTIDSQVESRFSVSFSLDEASPFHLNADFALDGGIYCDPAIWGNTAQISLTLTGPGGAVVDTSVMVASDDCFPTRMVREAGQLVPGVYDLELVVSGAGTGFCFGAFEGDCFKLPSSGEYSLKLALGPRPVPVLSGGALGILAGMLAILGAKRARGVA
jgi:hypothetical protein